MKNEMEEVFDSIPKDILSGEFGLVLGKVGALRQIYRDQTDYIKTLESQIQILRGALRDPDPDPALAKAVESLREHGLRLLNLEQILKKMNGDG